MLRKYKKHFSAVMAIFIMYGIMQLVGITCPIKFLTGISCAGCGMTRAWISLLHLDFKRAFYYHPLFFMPPLAVVLISRKSCINPKIYKILLWTGILLFAIIYFYRMIDGKNDIVVFEPQNGLLYHLIKILLGRRKSYVLYKMW